ncbi:MAG: RNA methyltransferase [Pseudomonadota bacterium]
MFESVRIVLVETSHPGNIGAAARALKTMGFSRLVLVRPQCEPLSSVAVARASGAHSVLNNAVVVPDLVSAMADCTCVIGTSARQREAPWQALGPRACADLAQQQAQQGEVALVFGRESSGLTREELDQCTHWVHVPTDPDYGSLNVAMAVQILTYELRMQALADSTAAPEPVTDPRDQPATGAQKAGLFRHLQTTLLQTGFVRPGHERSTMHRLQRLLQRAAPVQREVQMLRGVLSAVQRSLPSTQRPE